MWRRHKDHFCSGRGGQGLQRKQEGRRMRDAAGAPSGGHPYPKTAKSPQHTVCKVLNHTDLNLSIWTPQKKSLYECDYFNI